MLLREEEEDFRDRTKLIRELSEGSQYAQQLMNLMAAPSDDNRLELQKILIEAVVHSFESAIAILKADEGGRKMAGDQGGLQHPESPTRENAEIQGRGSCKKRKPSQMPTATTTISAIHEEDGYAWRKYGQKDILGSKFPRSYFRCTHKMDQGCPAIKQVQRLDHNPSLLQITYMGSHKCKPTHGSPDLAGASADPSERQEFFLNFETNSMPSCFPLQTSLFKQEENEDMLFDTMSSHRTSHHSSLQSSADGSFDLLKHLRVDSSHGGDLGPVECSFPGIDMGLVRFVEFDDLD